MHNLFKIEVLIMWTMLTFVVCFNSLAQSNLPGEVGVNNASIFYYHQNINPKNLESSEFVKPYLAYLNKNGEVSDYLMDAFLLFDVEHYYNKVNESSDDFFSYYLDNTFVKARMIDISEENIDGDNSNSAYISEVRPKPKKSIAQKWIEISNTDVSYTLSCYAKVLSDEVYKDIFIGYKLYDANFDEIIEEAESTWWDTYGIYGKWGVANDTGWTKNKFTFNVPIETKYISVFFGRYEAPSAIIIDNAELTVEGNSNNLITDSNFNDAREQTIWESGELNRQEYLFKDRKAALSIIGDAKIEIDNLLGKNKSIKIIIPVSKPEEGFDLNKYKTIINNYFDKIQAGFDTWKSKSDYQNLNIEISGIYYAQESFKNRKDHLSFLKESVNSRGWKLFASPYNNPYNRSSVGPDGLTEEITSSFDCIWLQPNAFFRSKGYNTDIDMLNWIYTEVGKNRNLGVNIETRAINKEENEPYARVLDYFDYGYKYGYVNTSHLYYDAGAYYLNAHSSDELLRQDYDALYDFIRRNKAGDIINGDFELIDDVNNSQFYNWSGSYIIHKEKLIEANGLDRSLSFVNDAFTSKILVDKNSNYLVSFQLNELVNDNQTSALLGIKFFNGNGDEITSSNGDFLCNLTNDCTNSSIRYSSYLGIWYQYVNPSTSIERFNYNFDIPSEAVEMKIFFKKWGSGADIKWQNLYVTNINKFQNIFFHYYLENNQLFPTNEYKGSHNVIELPLTGEATTTDKLSILSDATYELTFKLREALPANCDSNDALIALEFFDSLGNEIVGTPISGLTWSDFYGYYYFYEKASHIWSQYTRQFTIPDNGVSASVYIRNWNCSNSIFFNDIEINSVSAEHIINSSHDFGQKNGFSGDNILNINNWNEKFPLLVHSKMEPAYYTEYIDVSCNKNYTFSTFAKETVDDGKVTSALLSVELYDENWNAITGNEVDISGLIWSDQYQFWYYYINVEKQNPDPWYVFAWQDWSRNFIISENAHHMKIGLYNWSSNSESVLQFQRPMLFANDKSNCSGGRKAGSNTIGHNDDVVSNNELILYPNPNQGSATLTFKNPDQNEYTVVIHDSLGKIVRKYRGVHSEYLVMDTQEFSNGIYFINLSSQDEMQSIKMIVE